MSSRRRSPRTRAGRAAARASAVAIVLATLAIGSCGEDEASSCPTRTEPLTEVELDLFHQLEVCASRIVGRTLRRDPPPRVEQDPPVVDCNKNPTGTCVTTPAGQVVSGYYLPECDTITVVLREIIYHEAVHAILCEDPDLECDPGHRSDVWTECQTILRCPSGRLLLSEKVCDGTPDCDDGADESAAQCGG